MAMSKKTTNPELANLIIRRGELMNTKPKTQDQHNELARVNRAVSKDLPNQEWR